MQLEMFKDVIRVYTTRTIIDCITFEQINYDRMFFFQLIWLKRKALFRECSPTYFLRKLISAKIREYKNKTKLRQTTFNKQALFIKSLLFLMEYPNYQVKIQITHLTSSKVCPKLSISREHFWVSNG